MCQTARRASQRRTLGRLGRTLSDGIGRAAIPTAFPVSRPQAKFKAGSRTGMSRDLVLLRP